MQRALSGRLSLSSIMTVKRVYSVFLCVPLISVLFFPLAAAGRVLLGTPQKVIFLPSTAAGRILLHTAQTEGEGGYHGGNDGNKIGVTGSHSKTASSRTGSSSPSANTPVRKSTSASKVACGASRYTECLPSKPPPARKCGTYRRSCK